jgi:hypothetical protein
MCVLIKTVNSVGVKNGALWYKKCMEWAILKWQNSNFTHFNLVQTLLLQIHSQTQQANP